MRSLNAVKVSFLWFLFMIVTTLSCIPSDREALLKFKHGLEDPSNRLSSWASGGHVDGCCSWYGVVCDNFTGHVFELHLSSIPLEEYGASFNGTGDVEEHWKRSVFGGKISPSLLNLKHLRFLDLSSNYFGGINIPAFLGSLKSLRYLDLSHAGFGGMIPHQLGNLSNLQHLNLNGGVSYYSPDQYVQSLHWLSSLSSLEFLDLSHVNLNKAIDWFDVLNKLSSLFELYLSSCQLNPIPQNIPHVNLSSLAYLDLSSNDFSQVPSYILSLKTLTSLDLSENSFVAPISIHLQNITSLKELYLSDSNLTSAIFDRLQGFTHLQLLDLASNDNLQGQIPSSIGNLTSLNSLDLSHCSLKGGIPSAIGNLTSLNSFDLSVNRLEGVIPSSIGNLASVSSLDMSDNGLEGGIPAWFKNLCNLRSLDLSNNKLSQATNEIIEILSECASKTIESLELYSNLLSGHFTDLLGEFKNLIGLDLHDNLITGPIPTNLGELNSLHNLFLQNNKLNGNLPVSLSILSNLEWLDISHNSLEGEVSEIHFCNLKNLTNFYASGNHLILRVSPDDWVPPFQGLKELALRSWQIGPLFPTWIRSLSHLKFLDLSNSKISKTFPVWFHSWSSTLHEFNLSYNQMHGNIPYLSIDDSDYLSSIDLSSNHFEGSLPQISSNLTWLDLSNNSFSGSICSFLCDKKHEPRTTVILKLGENLLSGEIPDCWTNWISLSVIRLSSNNFSGNIPRSIGSLSELRVLSLRNNHLSGELPFSLAYCRVLIVLDVSANEFRGEVPSWMGTQLQWMIILNLRGNKFRGLIPEELCSMTFLHILDFADNSLNGTIPKCINNLTAMFGGASDPEDGVLSWVNYALTYSESASIMRSRREVEYSTILNLVRSLDLSNNKLSGEIPSDITSLVALQSLNLSHNLLSGRIPKDIGAMKALESLDFSQNQLSGEIPQSMSSLTFLSNLNLSNNKLSGMIPSSTQLRGFDSSSFSGNNLCGLPLIQKCSKDDARPGIDKENEPGGVDWFFFYVSIAPGFVIGFWGVLGPLIFNRRWRHLYFNFLNDLWTKISVWFYVYIVRVVRDFRVQRKA